MAREHPIAGFKKLLVRRKILIVKRPVGMFVQFLVALVETVDRQEERLRIGGMNADYFRSMDIPLVKGRFFSDHDRSDSQQASIIDEKFSRRFWPDDNPVGKHLWFDAKKLITIVGVVGVVKQYGLDNEGKIAVYFPHQQMAANDMFLAARTTSDPAGLAGPITREIHAVDPNVVV
jgi:MacB-like periplasmic core domain